MILVRPRSRRAGRRAAGRAPPALLVDDASLSASIRCRVSSPRRGEWHTRVETDNRMTATATQFLVTHGGDADEHDECV